MKKLTRDGFMVALLILNGLGGFLSCHTTHAGREEPEKTRPITIMCVLEAAEGQVDALKSTLLKIAEQSRQEATNIAYRVHQSWENPAQFILYETWTNDADHKQQFSKPYILAFIEKSKTLLGKPYQGYSARELS